MSVGSRISGPLLPHVGGQNPLQLEFQVQERRYLQGLIDFARIGLTPIRRALEGAAPDAAFGGFSLGFSIAIGIAGSAAEINGIAIAHKRLAKIGHTFGATDRDHAAEAVGRARFAIHIAAVDERGELRFRRPAAQPRLP